MPTAISTPLTESWYGSGERLGYDLKRRHIDATFASKVFVKVEGDASTAVTFKPGFPDGSVGWAKVFEHLPAADAMPKLFVEYVGMGDSDKPRDYPYSIKERADLVEALWRYYGTKSTVLVSFDFSSLVVLELLARRLEGRPSIPSIRGVFIFNGGLFPDGHTHPWHTTPVLRRVPIDKLPALTQAPFFTFKRTARVMWSKHYRNWETDARTVYTALRRHDGMFFIYRAADFVIQHQAQGNRLDFGRLYEKYERAFPFFVGGSTEDPFEHRQVRFAEKRLGGRGIEIARLPGGHLTTMERPSELASLITDFYDRVTANLNSVGVTPVVRLNDREK